MVDRITDSVNRTAATPAAPIKKVSDRRSPRTVIGFDKVAAIGRVLAGVEVTTTWGQPTLKVNGRMFVCMASHKSAEPNTLVVMMDLAEREALLEEAPETYYLGTLKVELASFGDIACDRVLPPCASTMPFTIRA